MDANRTERQETEAAPQERKSRRSSRKERVPLNAMQQKLQAPQREGYVRRFVNDEGGRIKDFERAGYTHVEDSEIHTDGTGERISRRVGVHEDGSPMYAYLMEQDQKWYAEDQDTKQAELDKADAAIQRGEIAGQVGSDGRYVGKQGITYKRS